MRSSIRWMLAGVVYVAVGSGLLACGGGSGGGGNTPPPPPDAPYGLTSRTPLAPLAFPSSQATPRPVDLPRAYPALGFSRPIFVTSAPAPDGTTWMYVLEQGGRIYVFRNDDAVQVAGRSTFIDLSTANGGPVSRASGEEGLLGIAFDPGFGEPGNAHAGEFYLHYSASNPRRSVIARYTATFPNGQAPTALPSTAASILQVPQPYGNHNAGMLAFGPDNYLYIAFGDGGSGGDPQKNSQNLGTLLGSMLRIDPRNPPNGSAYGIPADNPFLTTNGAAPEAWAYGLRNPWRFSFDRNTGDLWVGDVGQVAREEVSIVSRAANLGWPIYEGNAVYDGGQPATNFTPPVIDYPRASGTTVVGGYVYRGSDVPSLAGAYVYADYGSNQIWALVPDGNGGYTSNTEIQTLNNVVSFGEDEDAELLAVSINGGIYRFAEPSGGPPPPPAFPTLLSETGLFTDVATLTPNPGLIEYDVNSPLWSDDATKRRWIALPGQSKIEFAGDSPWSYPQGTVFVKHFELGLDVSSPNTVRRLETRVMIHEADGWRGYTYRWNDAQTDAELLAGAFCETFTIQDPGAPNGEREQMWRYPSRAECLQCHTSQAGFVLGGRTEQMNRNRTFGATVDNQLRSWNHIGLFDRDIGAPTGYAAWPNPLDASAGTVAARARSYLAANCAQCHRQNGSAPGSLDFRYNTATADMNAVDRRPQQGDVGLNDPWIIRSGVKESSVLWHRVGTTGATRMPPLGSNLVHLDALELLGTWIDQGPE